MTRHVVNSSEVAHLWAHKAQSEARNSTGSLFFVGDVIYSYGTHFPIARHVSHKKKDCVFFTLRGYSRTTSHHKHIVRRRVPHSLPVFGTENVFTRSILPEYKARIERELNALDRARISRRLSWRFEYFKELREEANSYASFFGLQTRFNPDTSGIREKILRLEHGCSICHRLNTWMVPGFREGHDGKKHKAFEQKDAIAQKRRATERAKYQEKLEHWKSGENVRLQESLGASRSEYQYMRIREGMIETTLGSTVPLSHVARAWRLIKPLLTDHKTYRRGDHSIHLGNYVIDSLDENGMLTVGCHRFERTELERVGKLLDGITSNGGENNVKGN